MADSMYLPDVRVEVAWNAGYSEGATPVWTDISTWVKLEERITITHGRTDEFAVAGPNALELVVDNSDGRFTPGNAASPYYPNVRLGRRIRVTATPAGGVASRRFTGYVTEWPTTWAGHVSDASASVSAVSRLGRLGHDAELDSIVAEVIRSYKPVAYWPLDEPQGATAAADATDTAQPPLEMTGDGEAVEFGNGTGVGTDDGTSATFASGQWLTATGVRASSTGAAPAAQTMVAFVRPTGMGLLLRVGATTLVVTPDGKLDASIPAGTGRLYVPSPGSLGSLLGQTHFVAVRRWKSGTTPVVDIVVDGIQGGAAGTGNASDTPGAVTSVRVGGSESPDTPAKFAGTVGHVVLYDRRLTDAELTEISQAGLTGYADELPVERIARYAALARIPSWEVYADEGTVPIAHIDTSGTAVAELLRVVERTDGGILFDSRSGQITYRERISRYDAPVGLTLDMALGHVEDDFAPVMDDSQLINVADVTSADGRFRARYTDEVSRAEYGTYDERGRVELATTDATAVAERAGWLVNTYSQPQVRVPALSIEAAVVEPTLQAKVLAAGIGTLVEVDNLPPQSGVTEGRWFIEGVREVIGPVSYRFTFNVSPAQPYLDVFHLDDPVSGVLDSTYHLG